ncbi:MAG: hypothetical protein AAB974_00360 [Patescibacteria group bacterium]
MARIIGIRHRIKQTAQGEARPTQVAIVEDGVKPRILDLADDDAELDFALGRYPTSHRPIREDEAAASWPQRHVTWKRLKKGESADGLPEQHLRHDGKDVFVARKVPETVDGLAQGDTVAMALGGFGDRFAYALSRRGDELGTGTRVMRIAPFDLKARRGEADKADDAALLARLFAAEPGLFRATTVRDRELIFLREAFDARMDAMKARIACEQRLYQRHIGKVFCSAEGRYPEGSISAAFDALKASDVIFRALESEEGKRDRELEKAVRQLDVYQDVLSQVTGVGPAIASRIIIAVGDIRTYSSKAQLKHALGVHVMSGGKYADTPKEHQFPRHRAGQISRWNPDGRQALFLLADQFNRRPNTEWGMKLLHYKAHFRAVHPEPVMLPRVDPKTKKVREVNCYTDGHIHKMALWRTVTKFVEWLFKAWRELERRKAAVPVAAPSAPVPSNNGPAESLGLDASAAA